MQMLPAFVDPFGNLEAILIQNDGVDSGTPPRSRVSSDPGPGSVEQRKPPFSVCHQVSTMTASPFPTEL